MLVTMAQVFPFEQHQLTIISLRNEAPLSEELTQLGAEVLVLNSQGLFSPSFIVELARKISSRKPACVQTHLLYSNVIGGLASTLARTPVSGTLHANDDHPRYRKTLKRKIETWVMRCCNHHWIAVADSVAESHGKRLPGDRMQVVENAVLLGEMSTDSRLDRDEIRHREFGISPESESNARVCIFVARLVTVKGHVDLIEAFAIVRQSRPMDVLVLVGDGPEEDAIKEKIESLQLSNAVKLLGHRRDITQLLLASDLYVSAAHSEGLPISLLEAMAGSLPIVHTDVGEVHTVISDQCGLLVPPHTPATLAEALVTLLQRGDLAAMGQVSREIVNTRFDSKTWVTRIMEVCSDTRKAR